MLRLWSRQHPSPWLRLWSTHRQAQAQPLRRRRRRRCPDSTAATPCRWGVPRGSPRGFWQQSTRRTARTTPRQMERAVGVLSLHSLVRRDCVVLQTTRWCCGCSRTAGVLPRRRRVDDRSCCPALQAASICQKVAPTPLLLLRLQRAVRNGPATPRQHRRAQGLRVSGTWLHILVDA
jgi:hypothetical protein